MRIGLFGGSFDPVHREHVAAVQAAKRHLALDRVLILPSSVAPHKTRGATAEGVHRLEMCRIAFRGVAEVCDYELNAGGTSYTYLTCRHFRSEFPDAELYFLVGADMLRDFFTWRNPEEILSYVRLASFGRGAELPALHGEFMQRFGCDYTEVPFTGEDVSSTRIRVDLAFGGKGGLDGAVYRYISEHGLYTHPAISPALALETAERREHSYRVALLSAARSKSANIPEREAILAAAVHDCGKNVPLSSPLLAGCSVPEGVPAPVVHQYTGAYLAQKFGVTEESVLDAVRYHASGRENMTDFGKLIYLADLLEPSRTFAGVEELRALFRKDLGACFEAALRHQIEYLKSTGKPIYPLTIRAFEWAKSEKR